MKNRIVFTLQLLYLAKWGAAVPEPRVTSRALLPRAVSTWGWFSVGSDSQGTKCTLRSQQESFQSASAWRSTDPDQRAQGALSRRTPMILRSLRPQDIGSIVAAMDGVHTGRLALVPRCMDLIPQSPGISMSAWWQQRQADT